MKTKSGKSHFVCEFRTYDADGNLFYENTTHRFIAADAQKYIDGVVKRYPKLGMTAEFKNVVNLDESPVTITLPDNIPGMVIEPPVLPEVVIPEDFDI